MIITNEALEEYGEDYTKLENRSDITFYEYAKIRVTIENMVIKKNKIENELIKTRKELIGK